jgi:hypothetical protein
VGEGSAITLGDDALGFAGVVVLAYRRRNKSPMLRVA